MQKGQHEAARRLAASTARCIVRNFYDCPKPEYRVADEAKRRILEELVNLIGEFMIKVLISDKLAKEGIDLLKKMGGVEPVVKTGMTEDELASVIGEYDGLIIRSDTKVTAKVLANSGKLKAIARAGVGIDNVDVPAATRKGIIVMNTPGGNTLSAAEHTMALMLGMSRHLVGGCEQYQGGQVGSQDLYGQSA